MTDQRESLIQQQPLTPNTTIPNLLVTVTSSPEKELDPNDHESSTAFVSIPPSDVVGVTPKQDTLPPVQVSVDHAPTEPKSTHELQSENLLPINSTLRESDVLISCEQTMPYGDTEEKTMNLTNADMKESIPNHLTSDCERPISSDELTVLRSKFDQLSHRLVSAHDQIDKLLEEKQAWLQSSSNRTASGELRGRWLQAKALAESYKCEKEKMVLKFAQSEQKCLQLEGRIRELESAKTSGMHATCVDPVNHVANDENHIDTLRDLQQRLAQSEKLLLSTQEQASTLKKSNLLAESKVTALETRLNQTLESLRSERQKISAQNAQITQLNRSLDAAQKEAKAAERLREREAERLCMEVAYKDAQGMLRQLAADKRALEQQLREMDALRTEVVENQSRINELLTENAVIPELRGEIDSLRQHEEHLSEVTRQLTEQNVHLQAEHLSCTNRLQKLEDELHMQAETVKAKIADAEQAVTFERNRVTDLECQLNELRIHTEQLRARERKLVAELNTERDRTALTHKRDTGRIRDLTRQLSRLSHASNLITQIEAANPTEISKDIAPDACSPIHVCQLGSRTESIQSFEINGLSPDSSKSPCPFGDTLLATGQYASQTQSSTESDRQSVEGAERFGQSERTAWLDKIDRLQRTQVRLTDKVEFLEEHCRQLTEELSRKACVIQSILTGDKHVGSASPTTVDPNRENLSRNGGLLASVFSGKANKETSDPEVCLEISQKLQLLLEDALFKNMTYKDNLNTLGSEISRMNHLISDIREVLCGTCIDRTKDLFPSSYS